MENKVKKDFPLMEKVAFIESVMASRGWDKSRLTKESGASSAAVTRFFQDGMINSLNTLKILSTLDLIKTDAPSCPVGCGQKMIDICKDVKELIESGEHWGASLDANIKSFKAGFDNDKELKRLSAEMKTLRQAMSAGRNTDTDAVASSNIGKLGT